jgi:hypothetical protein
MRATASSPASARASIAGAPSLAAKSPLPIVSPAASTTWRMSLKRLGARSRTAASICGVHSAPLSASTFWVCSRKLSVNVASVKPFSTVQMAHWRIEWV